MPRSTTLTLDEVAILDEAHARMCTEWETIRAAMRAARLDESIKSSIKIMDENLDIINDLIRAKRNESIRSSITPMDVNIDIINDLIRDRRKSGGQS